MHAVKPLNSNAAAVLQHLCICLLRHIWPLRSFNFARNRRYCAEIIPVVNIYLLSINADRQGVDILVIGPYCLLFCLCVCTVTDFSAEDKASGIKFCTAIHGRSAQGISHIGELFSSRSPKSDESVIHREVKFSMWRPTVNVTLHMRRSWNIARRVEVGMCGYRAVPEEGRTCSYSIYL